MYIRNVTSITATVSYWIIYICADLEPDDLSVIFVPKDQNVIVVSDTTVLIETPSHQ